MRATTILILMFVVFSCASKKSEFNPNKVCSSVSVNYLKDPRNSHRKFPDNPKLTEKIAGTRNSMQLCYEDFKNRTGYSEDFNTCLVVGIDATGQMDFYNFSSQEAKLDDKFMQCVAGVMGTIDFTQYGRDYVLLQSYAFFHR